MLSKYVWDNIAQVIFLYLWYNFLSILALSTILFWYAWAKIAQNNTLYIAETATRGVL